MNKRKTAFLGIAAAIFSVQMAAANATVTDWGVHNAAEAGVELHTPGSFSDIYKFTLPATDDLSSTAVANNLTIKSTDVLHISGGTVDLFSGIYGDAIPDALKLSYSFDGTTGSTSHSLTGLGVGPFYYEVSGTANGSQGGYYTLTSAFTPGSPVPEPETYGMLMAGLGLMGFIARKRSKQS